MGKVNARVVGNRSVRGVAPGGVVPLSRRDARLLARLGRVEVDDEGGAVDYESMSKDELVALAERAGLDVRRSDGEDGAPLKADYVSALSQQRGRYQRRDMRARD